MRAVRVSLFGAMRISRISHDGDSSPMKVTRSCQALLAYLLLHRKYSHSRQVVAGCFWADYPEERARRCLSTTLWRLRQALEPEGVPRGTYLLTSDDEIAFNRDSNLWLDVAVFEEQAERALRTAAPSLQKQDVAALQAALRLADRELLEGFYDNWALRERERLRLLYIRSLIHLFRYYVHCQNSESALRCTAEILEHDPLREEVFRERMRLLHANGQRTLALREYAGYRDMLAVEMSVPPMVETERVHAEILDQAGGDPSTAPVASVPTTLEEVRCQLEVLSHTLVASGQQLHDLACLVERMALSAAPRHAERDAQRGGASIVHA